MRSQHLTICVVEYKQIQLCTQRQSVIEAHCEGMQNPLCICWLYCTKKQTFPKTYSEHQKITGVKKDLKQHFILIPSDSFFSRVFRYPNKQVSRADINENAHNQAEMTFVFVKTDI